MKKHMKLALKVEKPEKFQPNILWGKVVIRFVKNRELKFVEIIQKNRYNDEV